LILFLKFLVNLHVQSNNHKIEYYLLKLRTFDSKSSHVILEVRFTKYDVYVRMGMPQKGRKDA
jgi:hypothetical protein